MRSIPSPLIGRRLAPRLIVLLGAVLGYASVAAAAPAVTAGSKPAARTAAKSGSVHLPTTTFTLPNGLTVVVSEDHAVPVVAVEVWYFVGSKDEKPGRTGFAHLFEHLMFQGSEHVADDQHLQLVAEAGGTANATTSEDRTNFFESVPANYLDQVLFLESDRMGYLLPALTQAKLDTQRGVVLNERRQSYENRPYGQVPFVIHEAIYPAGHPYHWLTIGRPEDLDAATLDDVKDFFRDWYKPANALLVIVGDTTPAKARRLVDKWFGPLPSGPRPEHKPPPPQVRLATNVERSMQDRVSLERAYLVWPSMPWFAPGDAELDLLATALGGKSGRLYRHLVYEQQVAQSVTVMQESAKLGSLFQIVVTARPGHTAKEVTALVDEELRHLLSDQPLTQEELQRAQSQWEASFVYGLEGYANRADRLAQYDDTLGTPDGFERDRQRYLQATVAGVMETARTVLGAHRLTVDVTPEKGTPEPTTPAAPSKVPAPAVPAPANQEIH